MEPHGVHPRAELVAFLGASVGEKVGNELIVQVATELRLDPDRFTVEQALQVMERVAQEQGIVGIAGRFAKTRVILKWGAPKR